MPTNEKKYYKRIEMFARFSLFVIYAWFGILKVLGISPAGSFVEELFKSSFLPNIIGFDSFYVLFSWFEVLLGIAFLFPKITKYVFPIFLMHMAMTMLPLILLPQLIWQNGLGLTMEGQYIIKNIGLIALVLYLYVDNKD